MKPNRSTRRAKQRDWDATHPYVTIRPRTLTEPAGHFVGKDRGRGGRAPRAGFFAATYDPAE